MMDTINAILALAILGCFGCLVGTLLVLQCVLKIYTELMKYKVLDPNSRKESP